ncbi:MAG: DNA methyltransferase [Thaumarchaeota archaeon]|nr:DNA methyltransferase [Nitrososphaerota archaeon]
MPPKPNWKNRTLCHGDNLEFLRSMDSDTVDLIATDPPFNKGRDFHATPDSVAKGASFQDRWSWETDVHESWVDKITDDFPRVMNVINGSRQSYGDDMGAFLCFMGVRILEMHRVLKQTGSMYLHCDPTASHYLKELMDSVFGRENFRNEIIWERSAGRSDAKSFARVHDGILYYVKSDTAVWNQQYEPLSQEYVDNTYRYEDERGRYTTMPLAGGGVSGKTHAFTWRGVYAKNWRFTTKSLEKLEMEGLIHWSRNDRPRRKFYLSESKGVAARDVITNVNRATPKERTGYPTQKPIALYERIIRASSGEGDIVLDPFCGCATTCVAAEKLGRQWIGIDIWDKAHKVVIDRLRKEGILAGPKEKRQDVLITRGEITYRKNPLERTDGGSEAVPFLKPIMKQYDDREHDPYTNHEKREILLQQYGPYCQGCGIKLPPRHFELDHKLPRAEGGSNTISNRILLCGPCNRTKKHLYTLTWIRKENKKTGDMVNEKALAPLR